MDPQQPGVCTARQRDRDLRIYDQPASYRTGRGLKFVGFVRCFSSGSERLWGFRFSVAWIRCFNAEAGPSSSTASASGAVLLPDMAAFALQASLPFGQKRPREVSLTPPRYLLYRAPGAPVPYTVGTWEVRVYQSCFRASGIQRCMSSYAVLGVT